MMRRIRLRVVLLLSLLVAVSVIAGVFIGVILSSVIAHKKEDPVFLKQSLIKDLEKLHPTPEQRQKFEAPADKVVGRITQVRQQAADALKTFVAEIENELTPEQRAIFEKKINPKAKAVEKK